MLGGVFIAANAQVAERPEVRPGDRWRFVVYHALPSSAPNRVWVVDSVGADAIVGTENGEPLRLTRDLNLRESPLMTAMGHRAVALSLAGRGAVAACRAGAF
jgi:hypothetical protein